jgi:hypothetical protein
MNCRHCKHPLEHVFLDLGCAPPSNAYLAAGELQAAEVYLPLRIMVCDRCWLVQTEDYARPEQLFRSDYSYFSSVSKSWLEHAKHYVGHVTERFALDSRSFVVEVASNDGYLLKNFVAAGVPCLGIEPTAGTAAAAEALGIPVLREFFGRDMAANLARRQRSADLILGNNVYAHVPDINDFTAGLKEMLAPRGVVTLEFPHLLRLIEHCQFDTVYHEHYSYLSLHAVQSIFRQAGLRIWDVEELPTHGGSLRVYGCHDDDPRASQPAVQQVLESERARGMLTLKGYEDLQYRANTIKNDLLVFLIDAARNGKKVAGYGAAAKGNTLLNYAGVKPDLLPFVCDAAPSKQGKFLPGTRIPVRSPDAIDAFKPDFVLILPWNIAPEVTKQLRGIAEWGGRFVVAVPQIRILPVAS